MQKSCLSHCCLESPSLVSMFAKNYNDVFNNYNTLIHCTGRCQSTVYGQSEWPHTGCAAATQGGGRPKPDSHGMCPDVVIVSLTCDIKIILLKLVKL